MAQTDKQAAAKEAARIVQQAEETARNVAAQAAVTAANVAAQAAIVGNDIGYIKKDISEIKDSIKSLSSEYITRVEFEPIKRIVYAVISVLGLATLGAIFKLIFIK